MNPTHTSLSSPRTTPTPALTLGVVSLLSTAALALGLATTPRSSDSLTDDIIAHPGDRTIELTRREDRAAQLAYEAKIREAVSPERLRQWHDMTSSVPHVAGSPGDAALSANIAQRFTDMGLEVEKHEIDVFLSFPDVAHLEIIAPDKVTLPIQEQPLEEDPYTAHEDLTFGWNAYAANGDVTAHIVYANYGTKEDFEMLADLGVDCTGAIVLARYGGNFRGYKAKFAQQAGAAGLIIYTDPAGEGFKRGAVYPEGGFANETYIQRGTILTLPYPGDPLSPIQPASGAEQRLDPDQIDLPRIPVQPVGYAAAKEIISRMQGEEVPPPWQGGLDCTYRLTGGDDLRVRLRVEQTRKVVPVWNIIARLRGTEHPREEVIVGAHHDAWSFGAGDPNAGTITVLESAQVLSELAEQGHRPARTIVFACWAAEEFGIIGSTEWVEANWQSLRRNAVAYINLDMAAMGPHFSASAAPLLKQVILDTARYVPQAGRSEHDEGENSATSQFVYDAWLKRSGAVTESSEPSIGNLGGGSDHVGFYCHVGVPSCGMSAHGSPGVSYHSNYETLAWYRKVVGDDYASATMVTQMAATTAGRIANSTLIPYDITRYGPDVIGHLEDLSSRAFVTGYADDSTLRSERFPALLKEFEDIALAADSYAQEARLLDRLLHTGAIIDRQDERTISDINRTLILLEGYWIQYAGLPGRPWYRNWYAATDEDSGYASWMLPGLRWHVEHPDETDSRANALSWYSRVLYDMRDRLRNLRESLNL